MQTIEGGKTMRQTLLKKFGSQEAITEHYRKLGALGGKKSSNGGFGQGEAGRERAKKWGAVGGAKSRRTKKES